MSIFMAVMHSVTAERFCVRGVPPRAELMLTADCYVHTHHSDYVTRDGKAASRYFVHPMGEGNANG